MPIEYDGNVSCQYLGYDWGFKKDGGPYNGTFPFDLSNGGTHTGGAPNDPWNSVTMSSSDGVYLSWTSTMGIYAVIMKGGDASNSYVYYPNPGYSDSGLASPVNASGSPAAISHVEFCYEYSFDYDGNATKTAAGTYDKTVTWTLTKSVAPASHSGSPGDSFSSTWTVVADKTETLGNYKVSGTITVKNPHPTQSVGITITDFVGVAATVTCPGTGDNTATLAANDGAAGGPDEVTCSYTASLGDSPETLPTVNMATIVSGNQSVGGGDATADVSFTANLIGYDSGTLADARFTYSQTISADSTVTFDETFACSTDAGKYTNGSYSFTEKNTATLNGNIGLSASAEVKVDCTLKALKATKTAAGTYDRTVTWTLTKSVDPSSHSGYAGDSFNSTWTVVADKTETLGNYKVEGSIFINNPASIAQAFTVSDVLNDGTTATVTCPSSTVAAGATVECSYTASPGGKTATLNTATVTATGNADQTATADVSFTANLIGYDSGTLADERFRYSNTISGDTTVTFPETFTCSTDPSKYTNGKYSTTYLNTATLNGNIGLSASAEVKVDCTLQALTATKTAAGTYDRTVTWTLTKSVSPASHSGFPGDSFSSTWTVVADKTEALSNYKVTGTISIYNPAAIAQTFTVTDKLSDSTDALVTCPSYTVASLGTVSCTYTAVPTSNAATLNTATVQAPGNADQTATKAVSWTENLIGYDSGTLADVRLGYSEEIRGDTTVTFDETFTCSADASKYTNGKYSATYVNTAKLNGNIGLEASATVTVDCSAAFVDVLKLTNGVADDSLSAIVWSFALYEGPDGYGTPPLATDVTPPAYMDFGKYLLRPDGTTIYTICEYNVMVGWSSDWMLNGANITPENPDAGTGQDLGNRCYDFTVGTGDVNKTFGFIVDNTRPGGDPRTPGYWKNWSSCAASNGGQYAKTLPGVDPDNNFISLDEALGSGIVWDDLLNDTILFNIESCQAAVSILDQRVVSNTSVNGKKYASDGARTLAMHLLAYQLNDAAGACVPTQPIDVGGGVMMTIGAIAIEAEKLLDKINFVGADTTYLRSNNPDYAIALKWAKFLDNYNNGMYCGSLVP